MELQTTPENLDEHRIFLNKTNEALNEVKNWRNQGNPRPVKKRRMESNTSVFCITCADGNFPTDAHKCFQCGKNIHILENCSVTLGGTDSEGYGEKRLCIACAKTDEVNDENAEFNRKDLPPSDQSKNYIERHQYRRITKYSGFRPDDSRDSLFRNKDKPISVKKNGNKPELSSLKLNGKEISFRSTCAFDILLYLKLLATCDFHHIKNQVTKIFSYCGN